MFSAYIYYVVNIEEYQRATSYLKSAALVSCLLSGVLGDILVVFYDTSLRTLMWISAIFVWIGFLWGLYIIRSSTYFDEEDRDDGEYNSKSIDIEEEIRRGKGPSYVAPNVNLDGGVKSTANLNEFRSPVSNDQVETTNRDSEVSQPSSLSAIVPISANDFRISDAQDDDISDAVSVASRTTTNTNMTSYAANKSTSKKKLQKSKQQGGAETPFSRSRSMRSFFFFHEHSPFSHRRSLSEKTYHENKGNNNTGTRKMAIKSKAYSTNNRNVPGNYTYTQISSLQTNQADDGSGQPQGEMFTPEPNNMYKGIHPIYREIYAPAAVEGGVAGGGRGSDGLQGSKGLLEKKVLSFSEKLALFQHQLKQLYIVCQIPPVAWMIALWVIGNAIYSVSHLYRL